MIRTKNLQLSDLHAKIDEDFNEREGKLKEERQRSHESLDQLWPIIERGLINPPYLDTKKVAVKSPHIRNGRRGHFAVGREVANVVAEWDEDSDIDQRLVFDEFLRRHPTLLRERKEQGLRSQIANTLSKMAAPDGVLRLVKPSAGWNPAVYRRKPHK